MWQAQSFNHFRNKVKALSNHDKATLTANPDLWSVVSVLRMLEKLVESSGVRAFLATNTSGRTEAALIHEDGDSSANDFLVRAGKISLLHYSPPARSFRLWATSRWWVFFACTA